MFLFGKNRIIFFGMLLALAGILLGGYLKTVRGRQDAPPARLENLPSISSSGMETNTPAQAIVSASFSNQTSLQVKSISKTAAAIASTTVSLADIKTCMVKPAQQIGTCYDALFHAFLKTNTTADALKIVARYEDTDPQLRYACHPVVHAIGRETFTKLHTVHDSFAACDQTCHSGCYHGAMERFIRGDSPPAGGDGTMKHISDEELEAKITTACPANQPSRFRFQCLHGLGHALLFSLEYKLEQTLHTCDKLGTAWDRTSCWGGAFMENLFPSDPAKSDVSTADYHYPCDKLDSQYKSDCYVMQTTRMTTMGLNTAGLFTECRKAGSYALSCIQSIGRDLSNDARIGKPEYVAAKCELGQDTGEKQACTRGVIYALMDNTWDGTYAFPFCQTFANESDRAYCATASARYLATTYDKIKDAILNDCIKSSAQRNVCASAAGGTN